MAVADELVRLGINRDVLRPMPCGPFEPVKTGVYTADGLRLNRRAEVFTTDYTATADYNAIPTVAPTTATNPTESTPATPPASKAPPNPPTPQSPATTNRTRIQFANPQPPTPAVFPPPKKHAIPRHSGYSPTPAPAHMLLATTSVAISMPNVPQPNPLHPLPPKAERLNPSAPVKFRVRNPRCKLPTPGIPHG